MLRLLLTTLLLIPTFHAQADEAQADESKPNTNRFIAAVPLRELPEEVYPHGTKLSHKLFADPFAAAANPYKLTDHTTTHKTPPYPSKFLNEGDELIELRSKLLTELFPEGDVTWIVYNASTDRLVSCADLDTHGKVAVLFNIFRDSDLLKLHARLDSVPSAVALRVASGRFAHVAIPPIDPLSEITAFTRIGTEASLSNDQRTSTSRRSASLTFTPEDKIIGSSIRAAITFTSDLKNSHLDELKLTVESTLLLTFDQPVSFILGPDPERPNQSLALTLTYTSQNYLGDKSITGLAPEDTEQLARILAHKGKGNFRQSVVYTTDADPQLRKMAALPEGSFIYSLASTLNTPASLHLKAPGKPVSSAELTTTAMTSPDMSLIDQDLNFSQTALKSLHNYSIETKTTLSNNTLQHIPVTSQGDRTASLLLLTFPLNFTGTQLTIQK